MKKIFFLLFLFSYTITNAQQAKDSSLPVYLKNPAIPSFSILTTDSATFTKNDLPKNKTVVLIYFSPDCSHCQYEAKQIVQYMDSLRDVMFVWVSYHPLNEIKDFFTKYGLDKFKNVKIGRDTKYFIPTYYKVENTPFIAIYNRQGVFSKEFREGAKAEELIRAIR
jgi:cytochrome oxidase Cu insertion factor (SCO1/SenC/PrrC family)